MSEQTGPNDDLLRAVAAKRTAHQKWAEGVFADASSEQPLNDEQPLGDDDETGSDETGSEAEQLAARQLAVGSIDQGTRGKAIVLPDRSRAEKWLRGMIDRVWIPNK